GGLENFLPQYLLEGRTRHLLDHRGGEAVAVIRICEPFGLNAVGIDCSHGLHAISNPVGCVEMLQSGTMSQQLCKTSVPEHSVCVRKNLANSCVEMDRTTF